MTIARQQIEQRIRESDEYLAALEADDEAAMADLLDPMGSAWSDAAADARYDQDVRDTELSLGPWA